MAQFAGLQIIHPSHASCANPATTRIVAPKTNALTLLRSAGRAHQEAASTTTPLRPHTQTHTRPFVSSQKHKIRIRTCYPAATRPLAHGRDT